MPDYKVTLTRTINDCAVTATWIGPAKNKAEAETAALQNNPDWSVAGSERNSED